MGLSTDFMGIIPDWELVVLLLFLAIFVLVCVMACIKCTQFACEEPEISCPTCAPNVVHKTRISRMSSAVRTPKNPKGQKTKKISTERTRLL